MTAIQNAQILSTGKVELLNAEPKKKEKLLGFKRLIQDRVASVCQLLSTGGRICMTCKF
jgi:hypothetical protein